MGEESSSGLAGLHVGVGKAYIPPGGFSVERMSLPFQFLEGSCVP